MYRIKIIKCKLNNQMPINLLYQDQNQNQDKMNKSTTKAIHIQQENQNKNYQPEDNTFEFIQIEQLQIQETCNLINRSFFAFDPVYKKHMNSICQVQEETKYYLKVAIKQNLAFGLKLKPSNKLVGACMFFDNNNALQIYENAPQIQDQSGKLLNARKMQEEMGLILFNLKSFQKGEAAFGSYLSIDPQFVSYKLGPLFLALAIKKVFSLSYKKLYGIIYNPASLKIFTTFGGKIIEKLKQQEQNLEFCLVQIQCTQDKILNNYIESHRQKTLKEFRKSSQKQTLKSKL